MVSFFWCTESSSADVFGARLSGGGRSTETASKLDLIIHTTASEKRPLLAGSPLIVASVLCFQHEQQRVEVQCLCFSL